MSAHKDRTAINSCGPTHTVVPNWLPLPICCRAQKMPKKRQLPSPLQFVLLPMLVRFTQRSMAKESAVVSKQGGQTTTHTKNLILFPKIVSFLQQRLTEACVHRGVWLEPPFSPAFSQCFHWDSVCWAVCIATAVSVVQNASRVCSLAQITMRHRKGCSNYPGQEGPNNRATADHLTRVQPFATT